MSEELVFMGLLGDGLHTTLGISCFNLRALRVSPHRTVVCLTVTVVSSLLTEFRLGSMDLL